MSGDSNRGNSPRYDDFEHPVKADSDVCHNDGQSEAPKPTRSPDSMLVRLVKGEITVEEYVADVKRRVAADRLRFLTKGDSRNEPPDIRTNDDFGI